MKRKTKLYLRLNLLSLFFVVVSFISVTLAWFVYSGLSSVSTEVSVKAWYIELQKDGKPVSNDVVITLDDIYPGMETLEEEIKIKNFGDSDAQVKYEISSIRILDDDAHNYVVGELLPSQHVEDIISHNYPFHINIDLSKNFVLAQTDEATFKVSISWPLDSGDNSPDGLTADEFDSLWGTKAYKFKNKELEKKENDQTYQIRAAIKLDIKLTAEQYIKTDDSSDMNYRRGNEILFDVVNNTRCTTESVTCTSESTTCCIRTNIIDINNKIADTKVTLLPKVSKEYKTGQFGSIDSLYREQITGWTVKTRLLNTNDILNVISKDIKDSVLVRENISDLVIGNVAYGERIKTVKQKAIDSKGYFKFLNKYSYFVSDTCYWLNEEFDSESGFAVTSIDTESMKLYGENKETECKVIPVIEVEKDILNKTSGN